MRHSATFVLTSLFSIGALAAQGPPPGIDGFGGPGGPGGPGGRGFGGPGFGGPAVTGAPFSAIRTETRQETLEDGNQIKDTHTSKVYRDAEGRMRTESTLTTPSGATKTMVTIFDPVSGFVARLNPTDSTATKLPLPKPRTGARKEPPTPPQDANGPQVVKTDLGANTIAGVAATGTRTTVTIPANAMGNANPMVETREVWVSTALKIPVKMVSNDPRRGMSTMEMSGISQTAPDAALFQIPSGYTVKDAPAHGRGGHGPGGPEGMGPGGPPPPDSGSL